MYHQKKVIVVGGGPAGFFAAIHAAILNPEWQISILEQGNHVLGKVKISGGGRCNVTHACFDARELTSFYPRGHRELLAPFQNFGCKDTMQWFELRNVSLKTEQDGRVFPISDDAQTIIDCILKEALKNNIEIRRNCKVFSIQKKKHFEIKTANAVLHADALIIATGSSALVWDCLKKMGHTVIEPVPSLFTFKAKNTLFRNLSGIALPNCIIKTNALKKEESGTILITHEGLSGPAVLKLSAFAARALAEKNYHFDCVINWTGQHIETIICDIHSLKSEHSKKQIRNMAPFSFPFRFWENVLTENKIKPDKIWAEINKSEIQRLATYLCQCTIQIAGKSTNKEEFVTAGGIKLNEVDFRTMQSKLIPGLYFAGEVMDIDAVTGGFNFQSSWTTGFIAGSKMSI